MKKRLIEIEGHHSEYYCFGWDYFGPFLYGFSRWLYQEAIKNGYRKVFFFSRDGYMMEKGFNLFNDTQIETEYVFFSRKSIRQALLWKCTTLESTLKFLPWERFLSVGKVLEFFGFDEAERNEITKKSNIDPEKDIPYDHICKDSTIQKLYDENKDQIRQKSIEQDNLLTLYIEQIGMRGRCAVVDIGWHGSMQYYLECFFEEHKMDTVLDGFYIGINPTVPLKSKVHGYIYNENERYKRKQLLCFFGGYEKLFQGFDGSTYGYKLTEENKIEPVFAQYEYALEKDAEIICAIKEWQQGALDFIRTARIDEHKYNDKELVYPLIHFGMHPSLADTKLFSFFYNVDGTKVFYTAQKKLHKYRFNELIHALSNSPWKTGFMKSVFKVPFPYFTVYRMIRK